VLRCGDLWKQSQHFNCGEAAKADREAGFKGGRFTPARSRGIGGFLPQQAGWMCAISADMHAPPLACPYVSGSIHAQRKLRVYAISAAWAGYA